jgi:hypothetical protein
LINKKYQLERSHFFVTKTSNIQKYSQRGLSVLLERSAKKEDLRDENNEKLVLYKEFEINQSKQSKPKELIDMENYLASFRKDIKGYVKVILKKISDSNKNRYDNDLIKDFENRYFHKFYTEQFLIEKNIKHKKNLDERKAKRLFNTIKVPKNLTLLNLKHKKIEDRSKETLSLTNRKREEKRENSVNLKHISNSNINFGLSKSVMNLHEKEGQLKKSKIEKLVRAVNDKNGKKSSTSSIQRDLHQSTSQITVLSDKYGVKCRKNYSSKLQLSNNGLFIL